MCSTRLFNDKHQVQKATSIMSRKSVHPVINTFEAELSEHGDAWDEDTRVGETHV